MNLMGDIRRLVLQSPAPASRIRRISPPGDGRVTPVPAIFGIGG